MAAVATGADALRLEVSGGAEIQHLHAVPVGPIPGVAILAVAARNGPSGVGGAGRLRSTGDGTLLSWRAPGSATFGEAVDVSGEGDFLLEDGDDEYCWVRINVDADYLDASAVAGDVFLTDVFENGVASDDVTAAEALAGDIATYTIIMANDSAGALTTIKCWLDADTANLEISTDNVNWYAPDAEDHADVLEWASIAFEGTETLYVRRTIAAEAGFDPSILNLLHFAWNGG